jgi:hypothetical protein
MLRGELNILGDQIFWELNPRIPEFLGDHYWEIITGTPKTAMAFRDQLSASIFSLHLLNSSVAVLDPPTQTQLPTPQPTLPATTVLPRPEEISFGKAGVAVPTSRPRTG